MSRGPRAPTAPKTLRTRSVRDEKAPERDVGEATPQEEPVVLEPLRPWRELWVEHWVPVTVLFHLALAVRWTVLAEIWRSPYAAVGNIDSGAFERMARELNAGGSWFPPHGFYQSPFYGYALAIIYRFAGANAWAPRVLQTLAGALSCVLVYAAGTRIYGRRAGLVAGALVALYGPLVVEEVLIVKTAWVILGALVSFALLLRYGPSGRERGVAAAGLTLGATVLAAGQWLPALATMTLAAGLAPPSMPLRSRRRLALAFALAAALPVGAMSAWNTWHAGGPLLTSGDAGLNLYMGNNAGSSGLPAPPAGLRDIPEYEEADARRIAERETGHPMNPSEISRYWGGRAQEFMLHDTGAWIGVMALKFQVLWNAYEIPDTSHYVFLRDRFAPALRWLLTFALLGTLGLAGLLVRSPKERGHRTLLLMIVPYLGVLVLVYVRGRYRLPTVPFLAIAAGGFVDAVAVAFAAKDRRRLGVAAAVVAAAALLVNTTFCRPAENGVPALCFAGDLFYESEWQNLANHWLARGDRARAEQALVEATRARSPRGPGQPQFRLAALHNEDGERFAGAGDDAAAAASFGRAADLLAQAADRGYRPSSTRLLLAGIQLRLGRWDDGVATLRRILEDDPLNAAARLRLGRLLQELGRCPEAVATLERLETTDDEQRRQSDAALQECRAQARGAR